MHLSLPGLEARLSERANLIDTARTSQPDLQPQELIMLLLADEYSSTAFQGNLQGGSATSAAPRLLMKGAVLG
jgi:hypothetical protein